MDQYVKDAYEVVATFGITPVKDGNAWCVLLGPNLQEGICGFGDTPHEAIMAFYREFRIPAKKNPDENITVKKIPIPVEWTDEEKKKLDRIYQILGWAMDEHAFSSTKRLIGDKEGVELQDFLRSIAKPQEHQFIEKVAKLSFGMASNFGVNEMVLDVSFSPEELQKIGLMPGLGSHQIKILVQCEPIH